MVTFKQVGAGGEFEVWAEPPRIYLDHWAFRLLSEDVELGNRFLAAFKHRGTVVFSLMNVAEIAQDTSPHMPQVRCFLEQLGPHWFPMRIDPLAIIEAEETGRTLDGIHPCTSDEFLKDAWFVERLTPGPVSLVHVVDLTQGPGGDALREATDRTTTELLTHLQDWRTAHAADPKELGQKFPVLKFDQDKPMRGIYNGLVHFTVTDSFELNHNHARDLFHAIVSVRCADMVTLDKHWTEQVRKLLLPADSVKVYKEKTFDAFLTDLEATPPSR